MKGYLDCKEDITKAIRGILLDRWSHSQFDYNHIYKDFEVQVNNYEWEDEGGGRSFPSIEVWAIITTNMGNRPQKVRCHLE